MPSPDLISVVITTYNRSEALVQVLAALGLQTDRDFEVVVADDGSTKEHIARITAAATTCRYPLVHVWHPDVGFTASRARNLGVTQAQGAYLILLDGDCIPDVDFIARHRLLMQSGYFVNGSRVLLSRRFTQQLIHGHESIVGRGWRYWVSKRFAGDASKLTGLIRLPDMQFRCQRDFVWHGIRSCNMAVWRSDYEAVNGFDETFVGWGHEDADFVLRLHNLGRSRKNGFCATEVYHLWHQESSRAREGVNADAVRARQLSRQVRSTIGYQESMGAADAVVSRWG
jgi:GT2 family glycosyltransferase